MVVFTFSNTQINMERSDFTDRIGERLAEPEKWPDDVARVERLCTHRVKGPGLDIGSSDGSVICRFLQANPEATVTAVEPRYACYSKIMEAALKAGVLDRLKWVPERYGGEFSWVTATEVLEHLPALKAEQMLDDIARILPLGGKAIITIPNRNLLDPVRERWSWGDHKSFYTEQSFTSLLTCRFRGVTVGPIVKGIWLEAVCHR